MPMEAQATVQFAELKNAFAQSLGNEGAEKILTDAIKECGLVKEDIYPLRDALKICNCLKKKPGFIGMISAFLLGQFATRT